jgi:hypothetical protein
VTNCRVWVSLSVISTWDQSGSSDGSAGGGEDAVLGAETASWWVAMLTWSIWAYGPSSGGNPPMTRAVSRSVRTASWSPARASQE